VASAWAARHILQDGGEEVAMSLYDNQLLIAHPTAEICLYKRMQLDVYNSLLTKLSTLENRHKGTDGRTRLGHLLLFLIRCLVSRPNDEADYRQLSRAVKLGVAAMQTNRPILYNNELQLRHMSLMVGVSYNAGVNLWQVEGDGRMGVDGTLTRAPVFRAIPDEDLMFPMQAGTDFDIADFDLANLRDEEEAGNMVMDYFVEDMWRMLSPGYRRESWAEEPRDFQESTIRRYCKNFDETVMTYGTSRAANSRWAWRFEFFFVKTPAGKGRNGVWTKVLYPAILAGIRARNVFNIDEVIRVMQRRFDTFWAVPQSASNRIWFYEDNVAKWHLRPPAMKSIGGEPVYRP
jgi:hypothetical protein